ncbi:hypothetical protein [Lentibacter sp. XHP0401]|uniref:hypothetical protein n=1 Tax=Lentibacter sp. XHP0401 TaxID=2984334 RepID=UPI0021E75059|nr:hypothetical protein [Lentibacter sp. XHP0401]MCV2894715.1 hypothetical protein [Lentibacter sp. XHP0401]
MKFVWRVLGIIRRFTTTLVFLGMLGFLVLSHTVVGVALFTASVIEAVSGLTSTTADVLSSKVALQKKYDVDRKQSAAKIARLETDLKKANAANQVTFRGKKMTAKQASLEVTKSIKSRTKRVAGANLASVVGESIPFYGIAVIVGATTYELNSACESMKDAYDLSIAMDPDAVAAEDRDYVCGLQVPTQEEAWAAVKNSPSAAWEQSVKAYEGTATSLASLEIPDFSGGWSRAMKWFSSWLE